MKISGVDLLVGFTLQGQVTAFFDSADPVADRLGTLLPGLHRPRLPTTSPTPTGTGWRTALTTAQTDANADQADDDGDGLGDVCDNCPFDSTIPIKKTATRMALATSVTTARSAAPRSTRRPAPARTRRRPTADGDGFGNRCDNCANDPNPGQEDDDGDLSGDACIQTTRRVSTPSPKSRQSLHRKALRLMGMVQMAAANAGRRRRPSV